MQQTFFGICPQCKQNPNKFTAVNPIVHPKDVPIAVSYTHLDVYKRQILDSIHK